MLARQICRRCAISFAAAKNRKFMEQHHPASVAMVFAGTRLRGFCSSTSQSHETDSKSPNGDGKTTNINTIGEEEKEETDIFDKLLRLALDYVPIYGWNQDAVVEACKILGYPTTLSGMFASDGSDLVHFFVNDSTKQLTKLLSEDPDEFRSKGTTAFIRHALELRLQMLVPYLDQWKEAQALMYKPRNISKHSSNLLNMADEIWYASGDRSSDFSWYSKRLSTVVLYQSCEHFMTQDRSDEFEETWLFLDRRLGDLIAMGRFKSQIDRALLPGNKVVGRMNDSIETLRNICGLNSRDR